jgi:glucokinase
MILAGDIGGTKTVIAHYEESGSSLRQLRVATFKSWEHRSLEEILAAYLKDSPKLSLRAGCFGVAGTVLDGKCHTTNLPWQLDELVLAQAIGAARVKLLNDLEAAGYGMLHLSSDEMCVLNPGSNPGRKGHAVVIAAGTGLGEAILCWDGQRYHPMAGEGGHVDFAPRTDQEIGLWGYLRAKVGGRVSLERVLRPRILRDILLSTRQGARQRTPRARRETPRGRSRPDHHAIGAGRRRPAMRRDAGPVLDAVRGRSR